MTAQLIKTRVVSQQENGHHHGANGKVIAFRLTSDWKIDADDPFPYGWRQITKTLPDGSMEYVEVPLTPADFLDPQEEDRLTQSDPHIILVVSLYNRYDIHYLNDPTTAVFCDLKMRWGIRGLKGPAPDIAIVPNIRNKTASRSSFSVRKEGTRPSLVIEVVSPQYPGDDTDKVTIYQRAKVTEYIIINAHFDSVDTPTELIGYRLVKGEYARMIPDERGWLLSQTTGVWFGVDSDKHTVILTDARTGERLLSNREEHLARLQERQARLNAEARAVQAEAEIARLRALLGQDKSAPHTRQ